MSRIAALDPAQAQGRTRETLAAVGKMLGSTPNLFRVAAPAPSVLEGLVGFNGATARGTLAPALREAIALTVAQTNGCDHCLSAHSALGRGAGLSDEQIAAARSAAAADARTEVILGFARTLVLERGRVGEAALARLRQARVSDAETLETDIGFPVVRARP